MNPAEDDPAAVHALGRHLAELVGVAPEVGERDDFVLLVMVSENQE